jgi:hypothetical protein
MKTLTMLLGLAAAQMQAQVPAPVQRVYGPLSVETKYGRLVFENVTLWPGSDLTWDTQPWFSATIENTGVALHVIQLGIYYRCFAGDPEPVPYKAIIPTITTGTSSFTEPYPQGGALSCIPEEISIAVTSLETVNRPNAEGLLGRSPWGSAPRESVQRVEAAERAREEALQEAREEVVRKEEEAREEAASRRVAEQTAKAKQDADAKARREHLAKFPILNSGTPSVFVGADRKCSEQFVQAMSMDGLEMRKRLADLVSYGCGFIEESGSQVVRARADGVYCQVRFVDGKHQGEYGWTPCSWVE